MAKRSLLNVILVFILCYGIIFYNISTLFVSPNDTVTKKPSTEEVLTKENKDKEEAVSSEIVSSTPFQAETPTDNSVSSTNSSASLPVSAGAVKGKIISQYISPYKASSSYNKVYMKNSTGTEVSIKELLEAKLSFKISKTNEPQVLILHTHATETFMANDSNFYTENFQSRTTDNSKNMVKIGVVVAEKLNKAGIKTLHATTQHDHPQYSGSYTRAAETICSYLKKYPSIKVVIDLHRDAVTSGESDKVKLVTEIGGKKAAQVMLVMGSGTGGVSNFPKWKENLKLALRLQQTFETKYPTLARPLSLMSKNYNESLTTGSMLIEIGTDANSLDEAIYSAEMVGDCLVDLFNKLE